MYPQAYSRRVSRIHYLVLRPGCLDGFQATIDRPSFFARASDAAISRFETWVDETFLTQFPIRTTPAEGPARSAPAQLHSLKKSGLYTSGMKSLSLPDSVSNIDRSHSA